MHPGSLIIAGCVSTANSPGVVSVIEALKSLPSKTRAECLRERKRRLSYQRHAAELFSGNLRQGARGGPPQHSFAIVADAVLGSHVAPSFQVQHTGNYYQPDKSCCASYGIQLLYQGSIGPSLVLELVMS